MIVTDNPIDGIQRTSRSAGIVFMGMAVPEEGKADEFYERMNNLAGNLSRVVFVKSAGGMSINS